MIDVNSTAEAAYVRALKWDTNGWHFECRGIPESIKDKLKEIFDKWGVGFAGDRLDCKGNTMNVNVTARQWRRVKFTLDKPSATENK